MTIRREASRVVIQSNGVDGCIVKETGVLAAGAAGVSGNDVVTMGQSKLVSATAQNTTSGTFIDFTGIPSWAKRITVMLSGVSTSGTSSLTVKVGNSAGFISTGYSGYAVLTGVSSLSGGTGLSSGFAFVAVSAAAVRYSVLTLTHAGNGLWTAFGASGRADAVNGDSVVGGVTVTGSLDRIRLTTVNGTDTFDAGSVNIMWE